MKIQVLDHGYVEFIEAWGHGRDGCDDYVEREGGEAFPIRADDFEVGIIEAARQSTQGNFRGWDTDAKLLKTLFHHQSNQSTPFEMAGLVIEVQAPIFVFREWHRHRTQSYNEMSARYAPLPDLYYVPNAERLMNKDLTNKQAQGLDPTSELQGIVAQGWVDALTDFYKNVEQIYQEALGMNLPKEIARLVMPVGHYSRMRASANLRNWLAFLTLRMDPKAQWEIRQFANAVGQIVAEKFPQTWKLFKEKFDE